MFGTSYFVMALGILKPCPFTQKSHINDPSRRIFSKTNDRYNHRLLIQNRPSLKDLAARPGFWEWARRRKHARRKARPRDSLKPGPVAMPPSNALFYQSSIGITKNPSRRIINVTFLGKRTRLQLHLLFSFQTKEVANSVFDEKMIACDQYSMEIPYIETKLTSDEGTELLFCQGVSINNFWKHLAKTSDFPLKFL